MRRSRLKSHHSAEMVERFKSEELPSAISHKPLRQSFHPDTRNCPATPASNRCWKASVKSRCIPCTHYSPPTFTADMLPHGCIENIWEQLANTVNLSLQPNGICRFGRAGQVCSFLASMCFSVLEQRHPNSSAPHKVRQLIMRSVL